MVLGTIGVTRMTMIREEHEDRQGRPPEVEGEIRELVRRGLAPGRLESTTEAGMSNLNSLIQRVSGSSVLEIEKLMIDHPPGVLLFELGRAPVSERRMKPLAVVDLVDEAR
jgi:hypothetical protein